MLAPREKSIPILIGTVAVLAFALAASALAAGSGSEPTTALVSQAPGKAKADGNSVEPAISGDGRFVAFTSRATNLDPAARSGRRQVFVRDMESGATTLVSRASGAGGAVSDQVSFGPSISADGRFVAFRSAGENLSAEDGGSTDVFVRDLQAGTTTLVSRASGAGGAAADDYSSEAELSADGRHVAFVSAAKNLSDEDDDAATDVFVRDLDSGLTELISRASGIAGAVAAGYSSEPSISGDGRFVAFASGAPLSSEDFDSGEGFETDVFVRDRGGATTALVSRRTGAAGKASDVESSEPAISADGRFVAFESDAKLTGQRGYGTNLFVRDTVAATTGLVTVGEDERSSGKPQRSPSISADGRYIAFESGGKGLTAVDPGGRTDVFVRDMLKGVTVDAARASGRLGVPADGPSFAPSISADGTFVAFETRATNLGGRQSPKFADVYRRRPVYEREPKLPGCAGRTATILGTPGGDDLAGTGRADVILGLGGDDRIRGFNGSDTICSGAGDDRVESGTNGGRGGFDLVLAGPGADRVVLDRELGRAEGGPGDDVLIGSKGGDELSGGAGDDILRGGPNPHYNSDFLWGGPGDDLLDGGPGPNQLRGGPGRNTLLP